MNLAFLTPGVTLTVTGRWLDMSGRKQKGRGDNQSFQSPSACGRAPVERGRRAFSWAAWEPVKLVTVTAQEIWGSYMSPSLACHGLPMPASPLAGTCQGFWRTCICVCPSGNLAMTSLVSVILHHSLASVPCPDTPNN